MQAQYDILPSGAVTVSQPCLLTSSYFPSNLPMLPLRVETDVEYTRSAQPKAFKLADL